MPERADRNAARCVVFTFLGIPREVVARVAREILPRLHDGVTGAMLDGPVLRPQRPGVLSAHEFALFVEFPRKPY